MAASVAIEKPYVTYVQKTRKEEFENFLNQLGVKVYNITAEAPLSPILEYSIEIRNLKNFGKVRKELNDHKFFK